MKTKLSLITVLVLVMSLCIVLTACDNTTPKNDKQDRQMTAVIERVYQTWDGYLNVEMSNAEHDNFALTGNSLSKVSLEFSIDNGQSWKRVDPVNDFYVADGTTVYELMYPTNNQDYTAIADFTFDAFDINMTTIKKNVGDSVTVQVRIPESDTHKASNSISAEPIKLLQKGADIYSKFSSYIEDDIPSISGTYDYERNEYVLYKQNSVIKIGKVTSELVGTDSYTWTFTAQEELSAEDKQFVASLQYKFVAPTDYNFLDTGLLGLPTQSIANEEQYLYKQQGWLTFPQGGMPMPSTESDKVWQYVETAEVSFDGNTYIQTTTRRSFVLVLCAKADNDKAQSNVYVGEYIISENIELE